MTGQYMKNGLLKMVRMRSLKYISRIFDVKIMKVVLQIAPMKKTIAAVWSEPNFTIFMNAVYIAM